MFKHLVSITLLPLTITGTLLAAPVMVNAQPITEQQAQSQTPTLKLKPNQGINVQLPPGVRAYKGWLDDGSIAQIDSDRPFEDGATILHLVGRNAGTSKLSLILRDNNGDDKLYVFNVITGNVSSTSIVPITASPVFTQPSSATKLAVNTRTEDRGTVAVRRGLEVAMERNLIVPGTAFHKAVTRFISDLESGRDVHSAARSAQIDLSVIKKLVLLGESSPVPPEQTDLAVAPQHTKPAEVQAVTVAKSTPESPRTEAESKQLKKLKAEVENLKELVKSLDKLERRVDGIDDSVASLKREQKQFVARLDSFDGQQRDFMASFNRQSQVAEAPEHTPVEKAPREETQTIVLALEARNYQDDGGGGVIPPQVLRRAQEVKPVQSKATRESMTPTDYAHAVRRGLNIARTNGEIAYGSRTYHKVQKTIRNLNRGVSPEKAARWAGLPIQTLKALGEDYGQR
jgi:predicted negative regulator of RcsB-dependent stress response